MHVLVFGGPRFCRTGGFSKNARIFARQNSAQKKGLKYHAVGNHYLKYSWEYFMKQKCITYSFIVDSPNILGNFSVVCWAEPTGRELPNIFPYLGKTALHIRDIQALQINHVCDNFRPHGMGKRSAGCKKTALGTQHASYFRSNSRNDSRNIGGNPKLQPKFSKRSLLGGGVVPALDGLAIRMANSFIEKPYFHNVGAIRANRLKPAIRKF